MNYRPLSNQSSPYTGLCSSIGTGAGFKPLFADDTLLSRGAEFSRITIKCRTLGTNTYIAIGNARTRALRLTAANQAITYVAPTINDTVAPFMASEFYVEGDVASGAGVLEISGMQVLRLK